MDDDYYGNGCTCHTHGLCWYHGCDCPSPYAGSNPDCEYHSEMRRTGATDLDEYFEVVQAERVQRGEVPNERWASR